MRVWLGIAFMKIGMAILPARVRRLTANMIMYHVPGALTEPEKAEIEFVAQLVVQQTLTLEVGGSSPPAPATTTRLM